MIVYLRLAPMPIKESYAPGNGVLEGRREVGYGIIYQGGGPCGAEYRYRHSMF